MSCAVHSNGLRSKGTGGSTEFTELPSCLSVVVVVVKGNRWDGTHLFLSVFRSAGDIRRGIGSPGGSSPVFDDGGGKDEDEEEDPIAPFQSNETDDVEITWKGTISLPVKDEIGCRTSIGS